MVDRQLTRMVTNTKVAEENSDVNVSKNYRVVQKHNNKNKPKNVRTHTDRHTDPRIISHALAGKNNQEPRSCDTFIECGTGSSGMEFYDNSTILAPTSNTSICDAFATVEPDVEPTLRTSVLDTFAIQYRFP